MSTRLGSLTSLIVVAALASAGIAGGQPLLAPRNAQSVLYFPHLNEGGPNSNNFWQVYRDGGAGMEIGAVSPTSSRTHAFALQLARNCGL